MKKLYFICLIILVLVSTVFAAETHEAEIEEGRQLVESQVSCDDLTDEQLEAIGEYTMETMHPGEAHDAMHEQMGLEEGTEEHDQFHIAMANRMYCGTYAGHMMGFGMMGSGYTKLRGGKMAYGMMGTGMGYGTGFLWILYKLVLLAVAVFISSWIFWSTRNWLSKGKKK